VFAALLCTILFSVSVACGHRSAKLIGGAEANFWRLGIAALLLGIWSFAWGIGLGGAAFPIFVVSGVVGIGVGDAALFQALPRLGSRLSMLLIQCMTAPLGALIEWLWLGTTLTASQILCGSIILAGIGVALSPSEHRHRNARELVVGVGCCVIAALGGAGGAVLTRKAYAVTHASGTHIDGGNAAFQRILGGLFVAGIFLLLAKRRELRIQARAPAGLAVAVSKRKWAGVWPWVLINGFAGQTLGVSCMQWALETTPTGLVLAVIATTPLAIIPIASRLEAERPTARSLAGSIVAVAGIVGLVLLR
jgi:drug/metabolite transporter (DMT)-like permease